MRRAVRGLIESTMPSALACRARSSLDQWVRCSPLATGSRQARATSWALCRGGNLQGPPRPGVVQQELGEAAQLVASAGPPDGGAVAAEIGGEPTDRFAGGDGQDDAGVLDLEPTEASVARHGPQHRDVGVGQLQRARLASTHGAASRARPRAYPHRTRRPNLLHDFCPATLGWRVVKRAWRWGGYPAGGWRNGRGCACSSG